ncbi:MAG TPA: hypothetical protein VHT30_08645 [Acidimicrobiales bacterium]|nr:hypothetical protein [Acidimicrobiales bacterium]
MEIGTLQIEVGVDSRLVLFVWGLHSRARWIEGRVAAPNGRSGIVEVSEPPDLRLGVSIGLADVNAWTTVYDPETGWLRVAPPAAQDDDLILVSTGIVLGLQGEGELASVWLQPVLD